MKILVDSQGRPLKSSEGFYAENFSYMDDVREAVSEVQGEPCTADVDEIADAVRAIPTPCILPVGVTTVRYDDSHTENVVSNNNIRIRGNNGKDYTVAEWNAMFAVAGYDKSHMAVTPVGLRVQAYGIDEVYLFDRYEGVTYNPSGETAGTAGQLQHSMYNHTLVTGAGSGTDYTTGKAWAVTADGDTLTLTEANTGQSWTMRTGCGGVNANKAHNIEDRVQSLWAQNEWMRHRMAIDSGVASSDPDGTLAVVDILNASGSQAAVGEDMYFWIGNVNTNLKAKYNLNNRHTVNSANLTQAIADAIYNKQVENGVNMNDTGVNSASKKVLAAGSKGAEAIAVDGKWYIITPYITNPNATTATITNNVADSPAVYWAVSKSCAMPSDALLTAMYNNKTLCDAIITYLNNREGRSIPVLPTATYTWSAVRSSAYSAWVVGLSGGSLYTANTYVRYYVVGAVSAS